MPSTMRLVTRIDLIEVIDGEQDELTDGDCHALERFPSQ
jgi:hypothetical protein